MSKTIFDKIKLQKARLILITKSREILDSIVSYSLGHATLATRQKEGALVRKQLVYVS